MAHGKVISSKSDMFKNAEGGNTTEQNDNGILRAVMGKLGACKGTLGENRDCADSGHIYMKTVMEAFRVPVYSERALENLFLSLIQARDCSYSRLKKLYDFPILTPRSGLEWGLTLVVWPVGVDVVPCEQ